MDWEVGYVVAGPAQDVVFDPSQDWAEAIPPERWLWRVDLVSGDRAWMVFLDYEDGTVHGALGAILN